MTLPDPAIDTSHEFANTSEFGAFFQVLLAWVGESSVAQKHAALGALLDHQAESLIELCRLHEALTRHNYLGFLWKRHRSYRAALFSLIDELRFITSGSDKSLEEAVSLIRHHRQNRSDRVKLAFGGRRLDLDWIPDRWWKQVTGVERRTSKVEQVDRHYFEMCVFTLIAEGLQSGDLVIEASEKFSDYRDQFVSDEEFHQTSAEYCRQAGLPDEGKDVVDHLRGTLSETADKVDAGFPDNEYLEIENGEPILRRGERLYSWPFSIGAGNERDGSSANRLDQSTAYF
jgi:hypothetical protein